jgi:hypothetical protein
LNLKINYLNNIKIFLAVIGVNKYGVKSLG